MTPDDSPLSFESSVPLPKPHKGIVWKWSIIATVAVLGFLMWQCGSALVAGRQLSNAAVQHFHDQLNGERYDQIFDEADDAFQHSGSREETIKFLEAVHNKLGSAQGANLTNIMVQATPGGTFTIVSYTTHYERGNAVERFTWLKRGGRLLLREYHVESKALIVG